MDRCPHRKKEIQQVCQLSYLQQLCWKSLPRMWDLAEHLKWSITLLIMVVPLAEDRWHMRKHAVLLQMVCISYQDWEMTYLSATINRIWTASDTFASKQGNSSIPSKEHHVSSSALYCSHCFLDASHHQASGTSQGNIKLRNRKTKEEHFNAWAK